MAKTIGTPITQEQVEGLRAGDSVLFSGEIYTARDAAHKRLVSMIGEKEVLPFDLNGAAIYYVGPCPTKPGQVINSCGPTSAVRMDAYAPTLFDNGVKCTIAKGPVAQGVRDSIVKNKALYLCAAGGAGALLSKCVRSCEEIAFEDLGTESVKRLVVEDMPLIVGIDSGGGTLFK
jgi:fumarate hydratase subunit beta